MKRLILSVLMVLTGGIESVTGAQPDGDATIVFHNNTNTTVTFVADYRYTGDGGATWSAWQTGFSGGVAAGTTQNYTARVYYTIASTQYRYQWVAHKGTTYLSPLLFNDPNGVYLEIGATYDVHWPVGSGTTYTNHVWSSGNICNNGKTDRSYYARITIAGETAAYGLGTLKPGDCKTWSWTNNVAFSAEIVHMDWVEHADAPPTYEAVPDVQGNSSASVVSNPVTPGSGSSGTTATGGYVMTNRPPSSVYGTNTATAEQNYQMTGAIVDALGQINRDLKLGDAANAAAIAGVSNALSGVTNMLGAGATGTVSIAEADLGIWGKGHSYGTTVAGLERTVTVPTAVAPVLTIPYSLIHEGLTDPVLDLGEPPWDTVVPQIRVFLLVLVVVGFVFWSFQIVSKVGGF